MDWATPFGVVSDDKSIEIVKKCANCMILRMAAKQASRMDICTRKRRIKGRINTVAWSCLG